MPSLCGACKRDATEAARRAEKEALRASHPQPGEAHAHEVAAAEVAAAEAAAAAAAAASEPPAPTTETPSS